MMLYIAQRFEKKPEEMDAMKEKRQPVVSRISANTDQVLRLHLEMDFRRLERMYFKQEQIQELKRHANSSQKLISLQQLERLETTTNSCISSMLKRLFEAGYGQELKQRGLVQEYQTTVSVILHSSV
ncbi:hypothetical protein A3844_00525 [Paenibacillus helianthi]|uniref:Uncharacterized protein n=1 Tax=Paenibacillus helianthi TaxID=1349432 RepID=A0ABX3EUY8_9BACL|nr:hypothetical protein [Paenibacillus helianthi]OKP91647.1 hypothetical protein A3844_00525 [Paenibacillus helianthi]